MDAVRETARSERLLRACNLHGIVRQPCEMVGGWVKGSAIASGTLRYRAMKCCNAASILEGGV